MSIISKKFFHDEAAAFVKLEGLVWPAGPHCPHCGNADKIYELKGVRSKPSQKNPEGVERHGLKKCAECRKQFTVRVGTVFESSHIPLHKWLQAAYLMASSKKGVSAHQMHRALEITYKSAWFMAHRLREAMRSGALDVFGSGGGTVEIDETFVGREPGRKVKPGAMHKMKVLTLIDRETGQARSAVIDDLKVSTIGPIVEANVAKEAHVMTDEAPRLKKVAAPFAEHGVVNHSKDEYVNFKNPTVHTQTVENYFSVFKRGMKGVYQHCAKHHLHRYLAEYDFRYNNRSALGVEDMERTDALLSGISGKRLTYQNAN